MGSLSRLGQVKLADHFTTIQTAKSWLCLINLNFIHRKSINLGENLGILGIVSPLYKSSIRTDVKPGEERRNSSQQLWFVPSLSQVFNCWLVITEKNLPVL